MEHLILPDRGPHSTTLVAVTMESTLDVVPTMVRYQLLEPEQLKYWAQWEQWELSLRVPSGGTPLPR